MHYPIAIVLAIAPIAQAPPALVAQPPDYETWATKDLYKYGTDLLNRGRRFERAIMALRICVRREPANLDYQLALGCACASRFASVAQALRGVKLFEGEQRLYERRKAAWEKAQQDASSPDFEAPPPTPPEPPFTPDDGRRWEMSKEEALRLLSQIGRQSVAAFDEAHKIAESAPPEQRSEVEYTRGWGLFLLRRFGRSTGVVQDTAAKKTEGQPVAASSKEEALAITPEEVSACFRQCTVDDPEQRDNWHALGLSLVPKYLDAGEDNSFRNYLSGAQIHKPDEVTQAVSAFERALSRRPNDFNLLYQLSLVTAATMPAESAGYLEKAAQRPGINAVLWYLLAEQRFRQAEKLGDGTAKTLQEKALAAVRSGNIAPQYQAVPFILPVPKSLAKAWEYRKVYGFGESALVMVSLSPRLAGYISNEIKKEADEAVLRDVPAMMGMGLKAVGSVLSGSGADDLDQKNSLGRALTASRVLMGVANCYTAYDLMKKSHQMKPDERKSRYILDNAELMDYLKSIDKEITK